MNDSPSPELVEIQRNIILDPLTEAFEVEHPAKVERVLLSPGAEGREPLSLTLTEDPARTAYEVAYTNADGERRTAHFINGIPPSYVFKWGPGREPAFWGEELATTEEIDYIRDLIRERIKDGSLELVKGTELPYQPDHASAA